jgi:hypothetical protein
MRKKSSAAELEAVRSAIHDRWFDLDRITFDIDARVLMIPFWGEPTMRYPRDAAGQPKPFDRRMMIQPVERYNVEDRERIGIYSFNTIAHSGGTLMLRADPHVTITAEGQDLSIVLDELRNGESADSG